MRPPPPTIDGAKVLLFACIDPIPTSSGAGRFMPSGLAICQYQSDASIFLFACDEYWACVSHTRHQTPEEAMTQSEFEFDYVSKWRPR